MFLFKSSWRPPRAAVAMTNAMAIALIRSPHEFISKPADLEHVNMWPELDHDKSALRTSAASYGE